MLNTVIHGDCLEIMQAIPDKSIDLVLTDPPYGINISGQRETFTKKLKHKRKYHEELNWDKSSPDKEYFEQIFRISKNQIIFGGNYFIDKINTISKGWIFWDKGQNIENFSDGELIFTSYAKPLRRIVINRVELLKDNTYHPTQKPLKLLTWIIDKYSSENDTILDPFAGSGTTAIAALKCKRNYILIEKEQKYIDIINKRIELHNSQPELF